jgi:hypothetical protein
MPGQGRLGRIGLAVAALVAVALAAPWVAPTILFSLSIAWLVVLAGTVLALVQPWRRAPGRGWRVLAVLGVVGGPAIAVGGDWSGSAASYLPCHRNWGWLPSYLLRSSPTQSAVAEVGPTRIKVCYGSPRVRGRKMIGGPQIPFGQLWRTGANEPTTLLLTGPLFVGGIRVDRGKVSLYSIPGPETWEIILNRSTSQWGLESEYTAAIAGAEIGRAVVASRTTSDFAEALSIRIEPEAEPTQAILILHWEQTEVRIPLSTRAPR